MRHRIPILAAVAFLGLPGVAHAAVCDQGTLTVDEGVVVDVTDAGITYQVGDDAPVPCGTIAAPFDLTISGGDASPLHALFVYVRWSRPANLTVSTPNRVWVELRPQGPSGITVDGSPQGVSFGVTASSERGFLSVPDHGSSLDQVTIIGTPAADTITLGELGDTATVYAYGGDDLVQGGVTPSTLRGGKGNDTLAAGPAGDTIRGGQGRDVLVGGDGPDCLFGEQGRDTFYAKGGGVDLVIGGRAQDTAEVDADDNVDKVETIQ